MFRDGAGASGKLSSSKWFMGGSEVEARVKQLARLPPELLDRDPEAFSSADSHNWRTFLMKTVLSLAASTPSTLLSCRYLNRNSFFIFLRFNKSEKCSVSARSTEFEVKFPT